MSFSGLRKAFTNHKQGFKTLFIFCAAIFLLLTSAIIVWISTFQIPSLQSIDELRVTQSTKIYDKTGNILLYDISQNSKRTVVPLDQISKNVQNATIAIEDKDFYQHHGIDFKAIIRAIGIDILTLNFNQGGSTITQQVVKNSILTNEKFVSRKLKELVLAWQLERVLTKDEILSMYLNEIPYGGSIYGIEEASETFFGKKASDLDLAQSAYLASIPNAPTYYSPYGAHKDKLDERKNLVLSEMKNQGMISESDYEAAKTEQVDFKVKEDSSIKAPHFVFYVIDYLQKKYGADVLEKGGLKVITTLDYDMQAEAQDIAKKYATSNEKDFNASNAAIVAIDPKTGGILTMVGSRDYFDKEIDGAFNVTLAKRQPGSTIKPFVYSEAFLKGYTPDTVLFDVKTQFSSSCTPDNTTSDNGCYSPDDYDLKYRGPINLRNALAQSVNIPSVEVLYLAGLSDSINLARDMGLASLSNKGDYGLTLVLGGGEVTPLEMTSGYGVFANEGQRNDYTPIQEIDDKDGKVLETISPRPRQVLDKEVALKIDDILSDNVAREPLYGQTSALFFPTRQVAVKTGTTNDYRDAWIMGYTPSVAVGAWAGNNDNSPMVHKVSGLIVAPMWRAFMDKVLAKYPVETFESPDLTNDLSVKPVLRGIWQGGYSTLIDKVSGKLATDYTPKESLGEVITGGVHSILRWVDRSDPTGPIPAHPESDPQYNNWEYAVRKWAQENGVVDTNPSIPVDADNVHTENSIPKVSIQTPADSSTIGENQTTNVNLIISNSFPITKVQISLNGVVVAQSSSKINSFSFNPSDYNISPGSYPLEVIVIDSAYNKVTAQIQISVQ